MQVDFREHFVELAELWQRYLQVAQEHQVDPHYPSHAFRVEIDADGTQAIPAEQPAVFAALRDYQQRRHELVGDLVDDVDAYEVVAGLLTLHDSPGFQDCVEPVSSVGRAWRVVRGKGIEGYPPQPIGDASWSHAQAAAALDELRVWLSERINRRLQQRIRQARERAEALAVREKDLSHAARTRASAQSARDQTTVGEGGSGTALMPCDTEAELEPFVFRRCGEVWTIHFRNRDTVEVAQLPHRVGMDYIDRLLRSPGQWLPVADFEPIAVPSDSVIDENETEQLAEPSEELAIDMDSLAFVRKRLMQLDQDINKARRQERTQRVAELEAEKDQILAYLEKNTNLHGLPRKRRQWWQKHVDRQRASIRTARNLIRRHIPCLAEHLKAIRSEGGQLIYDPPVPLPWKF